MKVEFEELDELPVEKMLIAESEDHHAGQCVGYRCQECGEADETVRQIYHDEDCPLAGEHGRDQYDQPLNTRSDAEPTPELQRENPVWLVVSAETDPEDSVYHGEPVAFRCECGNLDDDLLEVVHDERCPLAEESCDLNQTDAESLSQVRLTIDEQRV
jgi:hypothetical protein